MKKVAILFGGVSTEHDVSVISGLQVIEKIDRYKFLTYAIKLGQDGLFYYYERLYWKQDYLKIKPRRVNFGRDKKGSYFVTSGFFKKKIYVDCAYLTFHGGNGESGQIQGLLEILNIPYTSSNVEGSVISMNKALTKEVLDFNDIKTVAWTRVFSDDIRNHIDRVVKDIINEIKLPVIIKPTHLGSSIAINIAKTKVDLKKYLLESSHVDSEVLIEKLMTNFVEYNISVRKINGRIETSEIERPVSKDEILSFADKYKRGGKKTGGMASLNRELPAKIDVRLQKRIQNIATDSFKLIRAKGMIRIDFMLVGKQLYVTEVNPIPGSMAFYLWEASGISFTDQITDLINQAVIDSEIKNSLKLRYDSNIVEKFVSNRDR